MQPPWKSGSLPSCPSWTTRYGTRDLWERNLRGLMQRSQRGLHLPLGGVRYGVMHRLVVSARGDLCEWRVLDPCETDLRLPLLGQRRLHR